MSEERRGEQAVQAPYHCSQCPAGEFLVVVLFWAGRSHYHLSSVLLPPALPTLSIKIMFKSHVSNSNDNF
jgi:hypothetical protein